MRTLTSVMVRFVSRANCNPILSLVAMAAIVGGVAYHFRDAILNVIKDAVMCTAAAFLIYAVIHITGHIVAHRRRLAHNHKVAHEAEISADPVQEAERVVSEAYQREGAELPKSVPGA